MVVIVIVMLQIFSLKFKGEERKVKSRFVVYKVQLHAQNASGFDARIFLNTFLNDLPFDKVVVDFKILKLLKVHLL